MAPERRRVFICGGSGSGKSTLARQIADRTGLPVHGLDQIARIGGGSGPMRGEAKRDAMVADILGSVGWVVEGIHLGWTERLLVEADVIIWLDHVAWARSSGRIVRRFVGQAFGEVRRQRGWRRFLRFRDYGRRLRELGAAIPEARRYHRTSERPTEAGSPEESRAATVGVLQRYEAKVIHCRSVADVDAALEQVAPPMVPAG